jgi:hypothetical protein
MPKYRVECVKYVEYRALLEVEADSPTDAYQEANAQLRNGYIPWVEQDTEQDIGDIYLTSGEGEEKKEGE